MQQATILYVDSNSETRQQVSKALSNKYRMLIVDSVDKGIEKGKTFGDIDLFLIDEKTYAQTPDTFHQLSQANFETNFPSLLIAEQYSYELEAQAFEQGFADMLIRPININVLISKLKTHLDLHYFRHLNSDAKNNPLLKRIEQQASDISRLQKASLSVMISLAEFRDECTGQHIIRTQHYLMMLARKATENIADVHLSEAEILMMGQCSPLHDIGKICIPDPILLKPEKLTVDEMEVMKTHAQHGFDILESAAENMGEHGEFLRIAQEIAISHHERWDGTGYPNQLSGTDIPISGRMMAIVDVYDALRSERPYKSAFSHQDALDIMSKLTHTHFDPELFECFLEISDEIFTFSEENS